MSRPKILIVEDDADARRLYALGLNQRGFEVKLAATGAEAVERVTSGEKPDVILLDWLLPLMDGGEVLDRLDGESKAATFPSSSSAASPSRRARAATAASSAG
jgi:CheY-like chemotaxis protein